MAAGGNDKERQKPAYYKDNFEALAEEIRQYLSEREASPRTTEDTSGTNPRPNAVLSFLSVDPKKMGIDRFDEDYEEPEEYVETEPDPLEYSELSKYGYRYLIEPIMDAGGHIAVSQQLGLKVTLRKKKPKRKIQPLLNPDTTGPAERSGGFLSLGSALDERIDAAAEMDVTGITARTDLFQQQSSMDREMREEKRRAEREGPRYMRAVRSSQSSSAEPADLDEDEDSEPVRGDTVILTGLQRAYVGACAISSAIGYGKGTTRAVELGLPESVVEVMTVASVLLLAGCAAGAVASAMLATQLGRSPPLWAAKGALGGLATVLELRSLGSAVEAEEG
ncbi:unnamed protein product [Chrysoparadoxa australica]